MATVDGGFVVVYGLYHNSGAGGTNTYLPAAIVQDGTNPPIEGSVIHYAAHGSTDGSTFDVRTSTVGTTNGNSPLVAASF